MPTADFVHLRLHSAYSLLEGALKIPSIVGRCRNELMPAVAITDTNNLFGALEFSLAAKESGIQPILGCQITLANAEKVPENNACENALVLLVQNEAGYRSLIRLTSQAFLENGSGADPFVTLDDLEAVSYTHLRAHET